MSYPWTTTSLKSSSPQDLDEIIERINGLELKVIELEASMNQEISSLLSGYWADNTLEIDPDHMWELYKSKYNGYHYEINILRPLRNKNVF
jgi:hypothetical protein